MEGRDDMTSTISLLNLPLGTILSLDGKSIVLQKSDFVGFDQIPSHVTFHLVTVRATSPSRDDSSQREYLSPITIGFIIMTTPNCSDPVVPLVRRFDPMTGEVSSEPVDLFTESNLLHHIQQHGHMDAQRVVSYDRVLSTVEEDAWINRTKYVSPRLLRKRGLQHCDKIIPGTYEAADNEVNSFPTSNNHSDSDNNKKIIDGKAVVYPPIPVLDMSSSSSSSSSSHGIRHVRHAGAKRYLAQLTPATRTQLFTDAAPASRVMDDVIERYYDREWMEVAGDLQLSYLLFLYIHCLSSFEHWRDLVALLSTADCDQLMRYHNLYVEVLSILGSQLQTMESDFFEDVAFSGDNFLVPAIHRLCQVCSMTKDTAITTALQNFTLIVSRRLPQVLDEGYEQDTDETEMVAPLDGRLKRKFFDLIVDETNTDHMTASEDDDDDEENDDEDGPVVVLQEEMEAFLERSSEWSRTLLPQRQYPQCHRDEYPLLFAAMMPHEDILMTCARALDEAVDVSLVREAAAYLEGVEAKQTPSDTITTVQLRSPTMVVTHSAHRLSGLQKDVLSLYRALLREAIKKDKQFNAATPAAQLFASQPSEDVDNGTTVHRATTAFVRSEFRSQAAMVKRSDFEKIEFKIRQGHKQLKLLRMPGTQIASRVSS